MHLFQTKITHNLVSLSPLFLPATTRAFFHQTGGSTNSVLLLKYDLGKMRLKRLVTPNCTILAGYNQRYITDSYFLNRNITSDKNFAS